MSVIRHIDPINPITEKESILVYPTPEMVEDLIMAVYECDHNTTKMLLLSGVSPDVFDVLITNSGLHVTPILIDAILNLDVQMVKLLLKAGADPNVTRHTYKNGMLDKNSIASIERILSAIVVTDDHGGKEKKQKVLELVHTYRNKWKEGTR